MSADPEAKTFAQVLAEALPTHTHRSATPFGPTSWAWSTPAGVWTLSRPFLTPACWHVSGPGGKWVVDAARVLPVLRALGAIAAESGSDGPAADAGTPPPHATSIGPQT